MASVFLAIDGGGTKCRARVCDHNGITMGEGQAGPAHMRYRVQNVIPTVLQAADMACKQGGISLSDCIATIGLAGAERREKMDALQAYAWPFAHSYVLSDAKIACLGAHGGGDGGIVIVGTGNVGVGMVARRWVQIGGYGFPSDRCSGASLGVEALRYALQCRDFGTKSPLVDQILARIGQTTPDIVRWVDTAHASNYASLAPLVAVAAQEGDQNAKTMMQEMATQCALLCAALNSKGLAKISVVGGLAASIIPYIEAVPYMAPPQGDALSGAILFGQRMQDSSKRDQAMALLAH
ncbi:MAG: BadF/BadG/BcrA/BcrD ATPase family protein [Pseudomonadota bacterium]